MLLGDTDLVYDYDWQPYRTPLSNKELARDDLQGPVLGLRLLSRARAEPTELSGPAHNNHAQLDSSNIKAAPGVGM